MTVIGAGRFEAIEIGELRATAHHWLNWTVIDMNLLIYALISSITLKLMKILTEHIDMENSLEFKLAFE